MPIQVKHRSPNGETRPWTFREILRGDPIDRPTHPMVVHFPVAGYIGALALDVLSRAGGFAGAPLAATWVIVGALVGFAGAAVFGLADRSFMKPGSRIRTVATRHMLLQYVAAAIVALDLIVRWTHRHVAHARLLWIALDVVAVVVMTIGADLGGQMVFKMGYRVGGD